MSIRLQAIPKVCWLLLFHTLWGSILGWSVSPYGLGVSTDAVSYLFAAEDWARGEPLRIYNGDAYVLWPPLYPMLIGWTQRLSGLSAYQAAVLLQFLGFALNGLLLSLLFLKIFDDEAGWALLALILWDISAVVTSTFHMVGTDYLFALFPFLLTLLSGRYVARPERRTTLLLGLVAASGMLLRYIGYTLVLLALWVVLRHTAGWRERLWRAALVSLSALSPTLWMLHTWLATAGIRRAPLAFGDYLKQFTIGVLDNFTHITLKDFSPLWLLVVWGSVGLGLLFLGGYARKLFANPYTSTLLLYGLLYTVFLFVQALIAYFNRLWGRFIVPMYAPFLLLFLLAAWQGLRRVREKAAGALPFARLLVVILLGVLLWRELAITLPRLGAAREGEIPENSYNTPAWANNAVIRYWKEHRPSGEFVLFSNLQAGVAFHTGHETLASPRKRALYGEEIIPLERYRSLLFGSGKPVYLLWIEPHPYEHVYLPEELAPIAELQPLFTSADGALYRLRPRQ